MHTPTIPGSNGHAMSSLISPLAKYLWMAETVSTGWAYAMSQFVVDIQVALASLMYSVALQVCVVMHERSTSQVSGSYGDRTTGRMHEYSLSTLSTPQLLSTLRGEMRVLPHMC